MVELANGSRIIGPMGWRVRRCADGQFKPVEAFIPMNLLWSYSRSEVFADGISPRMGKHCDLARIVDPVYRKDLNEDLPGTNDHDPVASLAVEFSPNTKSHLIPPGVYRLHLRVAAANCTPVTKVIEITLAGKWSCEEGVMFSDGVGVRVLE